MIEKVVGDGQWHFQEFTLRVVYTTEKKEELEKNPNRNVIIKKS